MIPLSKGEKTCPGPICTITQNFTPIGVTGAEISITKHIQRITADIIRQKRILALRLSIIRHAGKKTKIAPGAWSKMVD